MTPLRGRRVLVDEGGALAVDHVVRAWWRGGRPTRVQLRARGAVVVRGAAAPGEVYARRWVLVVGDGPA